ncbi:MAG: hypothetical protein Ct9H300mP16_08700 [Pseudomonadota bacterium]|nr:MAG: hypothetical protein Ct9H300mP16_08700 [Pseudomonadota bacterium]
MTSSITPVRSPSRSGSNRAWNSRTIRLVMFGLLLSVSITYPGCSESGSAKKAKVAAQKRGFPPVQAGAQNEPLKTIFFPGWPVHVMSKDCSNSVSWFRGPPAGRCGPADRKHESRTETVHVVKPGVGPFRVDLEPHVLYDRQNIGQWNWCALEYSRSSALDCSEPAGRVRRIPSSPDCPPDSTA